MNIKRDVVGVIADLMVTNSDASRVLVGAIEAVPLNAEDREAALRYAEEAKAQLSALVDALRVD